MIEQEEIENENNKAEIKLSILNFKGPTKQICAQTQTEPAKQARNGNQTFKV